MHLGRQGDKNSFSSIPLSDDFIEALTARADKDRYIILAMTDKAFLDMALNFYEASLRAHHISNFLFVGVGRNSCDKLWRLLIPCFYYADDPDAGKASFYGQRDFIRKMNIRTKMILDALKAKFTVIHSDIDVAFFGNPVQNVKVILHKAQNTVNCYQSCIFHRYFRVICFRKRSFFLSAS